MKEIDQQANENNNDNMNAMNNRKSSYQVKFESKQGQDKLKKDIMDEFKKDKVLTFRDMSHLSYFGMKKENKKYDHTSYDIDINTDKKQ